MQIDKALEKLLELRRSYSHIIESALESEDKYEAEDLVKLVGHLQASYDHLLAAKVSGDTYCVVCKHLPAALILAGEVGTEVGPIYAILSLLTDGKIQPCSSCEEDKNL